MQNLPGIWSTNWNNMLKTNKRDLEIKALKMREAPRPGTRENIRNKVKWENQSVYMCHWFTPSPSLYLHYLKQCSGLHGPGWGEWGWVGGELGPGKGLMTHVWTNGSQWSYLLIQPHYFTSIKYVCPDRSLLPPALMQVNNMLIRRGAWDFQTFYAFLALHLRHSRYTEASTLE